MVDILEYQQAAKRIFLSMVKYPEIVGGNNRFDTDLMRVLESKLLARSGADRVFCVLEFEMRMEWE